MMPQYGTNAEECYKARFYSYGLFGLLDEWVKRGFKETPDKMVSIFYSVMDDSVLLKKKITDHEYSGTLRGSGNEHYDVFIDIEHPRKSHCNCPHANGKRIICKHQVALYFSVFPGEADQYYKEVIEYEEEERRQEELDKKIVAYINSLSKEELRQTLYEVLYDGTAWVFEKFVREHIDY